MSVVIIERLEKPRLKALLEHFGEIEDPRDPWRVAHPLAEVLFLVVCGTICDCDDYDLIADWGEAHLPFLRRYRDYQEFRVRGGHNGKDGDPLWPDAENLLSPTRSSTSCWPARTPRRLSIRTASSTS